MHRNQFPTGSDTDSDRRLAEYRRRFARLPLKEQEEENLFILAYILRVVYGIEYVPQTDRSAADLRDGVDI